MRVLACSLYHIYMRLLGSGGWMGGGRLPARHVVCPLGCPHVMSFVLYRSISTVSCMPVSMPDAGRVASPGMWFQPAWLQPARGLTRRGFSRGEGRTLKNLLRQVFTLTNRPVRRAAFSENAHRLLPTPFLRLSRQGACLVRLARLACATCRTSLPTSIACRMYSDRCATACMYRVPRHTTRNGRGSSTAQGHSFPHGFTRITALSAAAV